MPVDIQASWSKKENLGIYLKRAARVEDSRRKIEQRLNLIKERWDGTFVCSAHPLRTTG